MSIGEIKAAIHDRNETFLSTYFRCSLRIRLHGYKNTLLILLTCNFPPRI